MAERGQALALDLRGKREHTEAILTAMGSISKVHFSITEAGRRKLSEAERQAASPRSKESNARPNPFLWTLPPASPTSSLNPPPLGSGLEQTLEQQAEQDIPDTITASPPDQPDVRTVPAGSLPEMQQDVVETYVQAGLVSVETLHQGYQRAVQAGHGDQFLSGLEQRSTQAVEALARLRAGKRIHGILHIPRHIVPIITGNAGQG